MNKLYTKIGATLLIALLLFNACSEEFLDKKPYGTLDVNTLATDDGVYGLLVGAYSVLDGYFAFYQGANTNPGDVGMMGGASCMNWILGEVVADNAYKGDLDESWTDVVHIEQFRPSTFNNQALDEAWQVHYDGVSRANDVLKVLKNTSNISEEHAMQYEAEARFLRAWYHYQLRIKFRNIPYITEDVNPATVPNDVEVWDKIEEDFRWGIENGMTEVQDEAGRATIWAARAALARIHMFQQEWTEAAEQLDIVIRDGGFDLEPHYYNNHSEYHQNNGESLFEVQYSVNDGGDPYNAGMDHLVVYIQPSPFNLGYDYFPPSLDLFNAFKVDENGLPFLDGSFRDEFLIEDYGFASNEDFTPTDLPLDPRVDWTIGRRGIPFLDWGVHEGANWKRFSDQYGPFAQKKVMFYRETQDEYNPNSSGYWAPGINSNNFRLIRFAHVLIWRAECAVEMPTPDLELARTYINMIRERASDEPEDFVTGKVLDINFGDDYDRNNPNIDSTQMAANYQMGLYSSFPDVEYARKAVHFETRLEFALEGLRFFDLVRWGTASRELNAYLDKEDDHHPYMEGVEFTAPRNEYFPIQQTQIDLQGGVLKQDPNWVGF